MAANHDGVGPGKDAGRRLPASRALLRAWRDRRGVTAVVFALSIIPVLSMVALAIDVGRAVSAKSQLDLAADAGVLAGVRTAAIAYGNNPTTYLTLGQTAGGLRFDAQAGQIAAVSTSIRSIAVTRTGAMVVGTATWSATYTAIFGKLFGVPTWPLSGTATASTGIGADYLDVEILLDNSPSMLIGATPSDIATLQQLTPCAPTSTISGVPYSPGALYNANYWGTGWTDPASKQQYLAYQCISGSYTWDGSTNGTGLTCPIPALSPYTFPTFVPVSTKTAGGPICQGYLPIQTSGPGNGQYPRAGAPCAFACHFDTSSTAGTGDDFFAVARSTIGKSNKVTLRFDVLKAAVISIITTMQADDLAIRNLQVGIFTFDTQISKIYPLTGSGVAGDGWANAIAAVGAPPTSANQAEAGIQPVGGPDGAGTDFPDTMTTLATTYLNTNSGSGASAASPRKVLFIVTDGVQNYFVNGNTNNHNIQAFDPSYCQLFKNKGYTIYVVYTPYYPLMSWFYMLSVASFAEATDTTSISYNLQACASSPASYISASDGPSLQAALQTFLHAALIVPSHLTQ